MYSFEFMQELFKLINSKGFNGVLNTPLLRFTKDSTVHGKCYEYKDYIVLAISPDQGLKDFILTFTHETVHIFQYQFPNILGEIDDEGHGIGFDIMEGALLDAIYR